MTSAARRWLELVVPVHAEAVEAVSEILTRVGHQGIAVEIPVRPRGGLDHTVKAYLLDDGEVVAKVSVDGARVLTMARGMAKVSS